jgi:hypothetical protein
MNVQRALSGWVLNARPSQAAATTEGRAEEAKALAASARAVRPLAASAPPQRFGTGLGRSTELAFNSVVRVRLPTHSFLGRAKNSMSIEVQALPGQVAAASRPIQALRRSAKPNTRGRAGTSCFAARAGGFGLFAGGATQRRMQVGSVLHALPNPSIEGDVQGLSPSAAPHVKR